MPVGDLILMGPPGSGKGTQARRMVDDLAYVQLATGDLFRAHLSQGTQLGKLAQSYMSKGEYVPDDVTVKMVRERLSDIPRETRIVFDGFPRTVAQAEALDRLLEECGRSLAAVLLLEVPRDELLKRLGARATCSRCQTVYSLAVRPPKVPGVCDRCGGPVSATARSDESPEVVKKRLEVYENETRPVIGYYEKRGVVRRVSGVGTMDEIGARLMAMLEPEARD
ncbi:MAG TPA: adenylate kinase [Candidatus Limnocylindria bacterium]|nr:adenylate kinase [Candidatus Limnocylindria bacterium]